MITNMYILSFSNLTYKIILDILLLSLRIQKDRKKEVGWGDLKNWGWGGGIWTLKNNIDEFDLI